jgi:hypothetical protein
MSDDPTHFEGLRLRISQRHFIGRVRQSSLARDRNTVIEPWVDVGHDLATVRAGGAVRVENRLLVNSRVYGIEASGTLYPIAGPGFQFLDRAAFKALGVYNQLGDTAEAEAVLQRMHGQTAASRRAALAAYDAGKQGDR